MSRTRKCPDPAVPTLVTLAEWVDARLCPTEALHEAGRLHIELKLAPLRATLGTDVRWDREDDYQPALHKIEVKADGIWCGWRDHPKYTEDWDRPKPWRGMYDLWNSTPLAERPPIDIPDDRENPSPRPHGNLYHEQRVDELVDRWYAIPTAYRPHFFLDPVVLAWVKSRRSGNPIPSVSLEDYMPDFQRYWQDVRQVVERDAKEKNGQDVHTSLKRADAARYKHGELRTQDNVDLLVGLLRAAGCELHQGACPIEKHAAEYIRKLIARLGRLGDLQHGRVLRALFYVDGRKKYPGDLRPMYVNLRRRGLTRTRPTY